MAVEGLANVMGFAVMEAGCDLMMDEERETFDSLLCKCRICLDTRGCIDIFEAPRLAESIQLCTNLIVNIKDNFPRKICRSCNRLIQSAMTLRSLACTAEFRLRTLKNMQTTNNSKEICTLECTPDIHFDSNDDDFVNGEVDFESMEVNMEDQIDDAYIRPEEFMKKERKKRKKSFKKRKNSDSNNFIKNDANISNNRYTKIGDTIKLLQDLKANSCIDKKNVRNVRNYMTIKRENSLSDEKPPSFICDVCNKKCKSRNSLYLHKRYHDKVKPYPCNSCEKQFATKGDLTKHIRVHTGEKPFTCDVCYKSFSQNSTLKTHMKIHLVSLLTSTLQSDK